MNVILLFSGDAELAPESLTLMAVCSDKENAVRVASEAAGYSNVPMSETDCAELLNDYQTTGRSENFAIVATELDQII